MNIQAIKDKLQTLDNECRAAEVTLVNLIKNNYLTILLVAVPLIVLKVRSIIVDMLLANAKKTMADTVAKDQILKAKETAENDKADQIIKKADSDRSTEQGQSVGADWYKKDGKDETNH